MIDEDLAGAQATSYVEPLLPLLVLEPLEPLALSKLLGSSKPLEDHRIIIHLVVQIEAQGIPYLACDTSPCAVPLIEQGLLSRSALICLGARKVVSSDTCSKRGWPLDRVYTLDSERFAALEAVEGTVWDVVKPNAIGVVRCVAGIAEEEDFFPVALVAKRTWNGFFHLRRALSQPWLGVKFSNLFLVLYRATCKKFACASRR